MLRITTPATLRTDAHSLAIALVTTAIFCWLRLAPVGAAGLAA
jgi:hypothetical protein